MTFTKTEFENIKEKHGKYASWAVWNYSKNKIKEKSVDCINENLNILNSRYVFVGLNISNEIGTWGNFRGGKHDRKLKYAFNDSSLKGSYMTDLFKNIINPKSNDFYKFIKDKTDVIEENVLGFVQEMNDLKVSTETCFIVLGTEESITGKLFKEYFQRHFTNTSIIYHRHYSSRGFDKDWVESIWETLNIKNLDFNKVLENYK
ncbi:hypothetical protein [Mucilaginibacter arboris]|uniref:Uncharacterized protein n=1 Tax=Mucilaginibacter arboris TaxID=2682090 RepID=A0A7K1SZ07_9SPHI|nr:hypothetical protein [Mucilaginibacter arboris]MVN22556.1 hypothetical protein [Mucilaginibacter arboris]